MEHKGSGGERQYGEDEHRQQHGSCHRAKCQVCLNIISKAQQSRVEGEGECAPRRLQPKRPPPD